MDPIDVGYKVVKHLRPATAVDIKDRLTDIRARLIRMIKKWERSGQGDGGRLDDDEQEDEISQTAGSGDLENITLLQLGRLEGRTQFALGTTLCPISHPLNADIAPCLQMQDSPKCCLDTESTSPRSDLLDRTQLDS